MLFAARGQTCVLLPHVALLGGHVSLYMYVRGLVGIKSSEMKKKNMRFCMKRLTLTRFVKEIMMFLCAISKNCVTFTQISGLGLFWYQKGNRTSDFASSLP